MMISYALNFEDVMLMRALGHIEAGFYIDVGANHPTEYSVTKAFYDKGWRGVNVEPMPGPFALLAAERPRDVNLDCALGTAAGTIRIWEPDVQGWATGRPDIAAALATQGHTGIHHDVPLRTLAEVWAQHAPREVHFLKIDVEGLEKDVLSGSDFTRHRPWVTVVEATYPNSRRETHDEWEAILFSADYRFVYADGLNRFYVAAEHSELIDAFRYPPNVFDAFKPYAQLQAEVAATQNAAALHERAEAARLAEERAQLGQEQVRIEAQRATAAAEQAWRNSLQAERAEEMLKAALARATTADAAAETALRRAEQAEADRRAADADRHQAAMAAEQLGSELRIAAENAQRRVEQADADRRAAEADRREAEADRRAAEEDRRAANASRHSAEKDRQAAVAERDQATMVAAQLRTELQALTDTLRETRDWAEWADGRAVTAETELAAARGDVAALRASLSWRITAPLRGFRVLLRSTNLSNVVGTLKAMLIRRALRLMADPTLRVRVANLARRLGIIGPLRKLHTRLVAAAAPPPASRNEPVRTDGPPVLEAASLRTRQLYVRLDKAFNAATGDDHAHRR